VPKPATKSKTATVKGKPIQLQIDGIEDGVPYHYKYLAARANLSVTQVRDWVYRDYRLPYIQLPRGRRVLGRDFIAFLSERYVDRTGTDREGS
jgi:hypothetical protein